MGEWYAIYAIYEIEQCTSKLNEKLHWRSNVKESWTKQNYSFKEKYISKLKCKISELSEVRSIQLDYEWNPLLQYRLDAADISIFLEIVSSMLCDW